MHYTAQIELSRFTSVTFEAPPGLSDIQLEAMATKKAMEENGYDYDDYAAYDIQSQICLSS